jgi:hypothetical protein
MTCLCAHRLDEDYIFNPFATSALEEGRRSAPRPGRFSPREDALPIVQETGGENSGPISTGTESLPQAWLQSLDRPARNKSL